VPFDAPDRLSFEWQVQLQPGWNSVTAAVIDTSGNRYELSPGRILGLLPGAAVAIDRPVLQPDGSHLISASLNAYGRRYQGVPLALYSRDPAMPPSPDSGTLQQRGISTSGKVTFRLPPVTPGTVVEVRALSPEGSAWSERAWSSSPSVMIWPRTPVARPAPAPKPVVTGSKVVNLRSMQSTVKVGRPARFLAVGGLKSVGYTFLLQANTAGKWHTVGSARAVGTTVPLSATFARRTSVKLRIVEVAELSSTSKVLTISNTVSLRIV
jgi:hypothetical protein